MFQALTDTEWQALEPLFKEPAKKGRGKPHAPWRFVLNSILYILHMGLKWDALPKEELSPHFAPKSVAHRWFLRWEKEGLLSQVLARLEGSAALIARMAGLSRRKRLPKPKIEELSLAVL